MQTVAWNTKRGLARVAFALSIAPSEPLILTRNVFNSAMRSRLTIMERTDMMLTKDEQKERLLIALSHPTVCFPEPPTLYLISRHRSRSGSQEWFDAYTFKDGEPQRLTFAVAEVLGYKYDRTYEAFRVGNPGYRRSLYIQEDLTKALGYPVRCEVL